MEIGWAYKNVLKWTGHREVELAVHKFCNY